MTVTTAAAPDVDPFRLFRLTVLRTGRLGPSLLRVTFGGPGLDGFASGGRDQSLSLFLPHPGQPEPVVPVDNEGNWFGPWRALPAEERAVLRSYTVRAQRRTDGGSATEIDIDFALHEDGGPACRWAAEASPGDVIKALGPAVEDNTAVRFRPPEDTDWVLIWADETALPAATAALEWLPARLRARVWLDVPHSGDRQAIDTAADARISWLVRDEAETPDAVEAVRAAELPAGTPYVWIAGEASKVRAMRRHLVRERGFDRKRVTFVGYWRRGLSEEQLREEATPAPAGTSSPTGD
ncbi:siderophore-interacting protein [Streptomyces sp. NPDC005795]|uniref:siderophore-interacting protein n=1 Tax=Streptomyces sp. NPDC005795 TaxID=3154677 RepID=UPI00340ACA33